MRNKVNFTIIIFGLALLCFPVLIYSQTEEETIRIKTRVVFIDALVKEKKSGVSVADLAKENFELLADGKRREISYFSREGDERRKPLALMLVLDLRHTAALDSISESLKE